MINKQETFDPRNKTYCLRMDEYDCFFRKAGKCSLDLDASEAKRFLEFEESKNAVAPETDSYINYPENSVMYCRLLEQDLLQNGFKHGIMVCSNSCGHYSVDSGQHRVCIGKRTLMPTIPIDQFDENDSLCCHCASLKHSMWYRIQAIFRKSYWFLG